MPSAVHVGPAGPACVIVTTMPHTIETCSMTGPPTGIAKGFASVVLIGLVAVEAYLVLGWSSKTTGVPLRPGSFVIRDLEAGYRVSQTMTLGAGGFREVVVYPAPVTNSHRGALVFELFEVLKDADGRMLPGPERLEYREVVPARALVEVPRFSFRFPEIADSSGRAYRVDIWVKDPRFPGGVGLWATGGRWSDGGSLLINDQSAFAELVFDTHASRASG